MTYILGWKNYSSVFLVGDSVVTVEHPNGTGNTNDFRDQTSFGEDHIYEVRKTVSEKWLKLYDLANKIVLAISGEVEEAHDGIKFLKLYLETGTDVEVAIENSFRDKKVGILAGYMDGDVPRLISYNAKGKNGLHEHAFFEVAHSGSIDSSFIDQTEGFFSQIDGKDWSDDQVLASIIAVTQSYGFQENQMKRGVGGFFSGIRINVSGVSWQPDLVFFPFSYNGQDAKTEQLSEIFGEVTPVMTQVKDSILLSCSSLVSDIKRARQIFPNYHPEKGKGLEIWEKELTDWKAKWEVGLNKNCDVQNADFYIFYNTRKPIVGLVYSKNTRSIKIEDDKIKFNQEGLNLFLNRVFSAIDEELTLYVDFHYN